MELLLIAMLSSFALGWLSGRIEYFRMLNIANFHQTASDKVLSISIAQYNVVIQVARKISHEVVDKFVAKSKRAEAVRLINEELDRFPEDKFIATLNKEVGGDIAKVAKEPQK